MKRIDIEDYLGITDNDDNEYKNNAVEEYKELKRLYGKRKNIEFGCNEDMGIYLDYSKIIYRGKYITAFLP